jgi:metal-responsive CopG/Arc/MetJ family transcriptional regulator
MKKRISITIDEDKDKDLNSFLKEGKYRNKSHIVEMAIEFFIKNEKGKKK